MCGIAGLVSLDGKSPVDMDLLRRMNAKLEHRGPDDAGYFDDAGVGLAMRRLSILDVEGGTQPIANEDGTVIVVYNGEIYNSPFLRRSLADRGHTLRSRADTEVLVHLYEEKGENLVDDLRGMFAFAIWDRRKRRLLLARDRVGKKPLYYARGKGVFTFASELTALRECPGIASRLDESGVLKALALQYIPSPGTPFLGVQKLPPGHRLVLQDGLLDVRRYWQLRSAPDAGGPGLLDRVRESVELRLLSDVPLGALLSGGVDSSAIVALMAGSLREPVRTFSVRFASPGGEEDARFAREIAARFGCDHHELAVGDEEALAALPRVFDHLDDPVLDPAHLPTYLVCRLAREHVKVVLTGEGGDEAFAGYSRYRLARVPSLPAGWLRPFVDAMAARELLSTRHAKAIYALTEPDPAKRQALMVAPFAPGDYRDLFRRDPAWMAEELAPSLAAHADSDPLNRILAVDVETWLADDLLQKVDRMSMAVSLEARTPLLDHPLLEHVHGIPGREKLSGGEHKRVFKRALKDLLPADLLSRRKVGFEPPWGQWFRTRLRDRLRDALAGGPFRSWKFINHAAVERLADRHQRTGAHGLELYCLFALAEWGSRHAARG